MSEQTFQSTITKQESLITRLTKHCKSLEEENTKIHSAQKAASSQVPFG